VFTDRKTVLTASLKPGFPSQRKETSVADGDRLDQEDILGGVAGGGPGREMAAIGAGIELALGPDGHAPVDDIDGLAVDGDVGRHVDGQVQRDAGPGAAGPRAGPPEAERLVAAQARPPRTR
jgi:hypothetical protein